MYCDLKQPGICHATPTHKGTTGSQRQFQWSKKCSPALPPEQSDQLSQQACMQGQVNWSLCPQSNLSEEIHQANWIEFSVAKHPLGSDKAFTVSEHIIETAADVAILTETWLQDEDVAR